MRARSSFFVLVPLSILGLCSLGAGCDSSVPTFPDVGYDAGIECGDEDLGDCASSEVCLQGRCYPRCGDENPCGPLEQCSSQGVCVAGTTDAGPPPDAGPPDPCDTVTCEDPTPFCRAGICLACESRDQCGGATSVCDVARGTCVAFRPTVCAACNVDADCNGDPPADPPLRCLARSAPDPTERVCVAPCAADMTCPVGFACEPGSMLCVPRLGFSCTGLRAALDATPCADDAACAPAGATVDDGLFTGSCFDGGSGMLTCHAPCSTGGDCPSAMCSPTFFCL
jgi:hypothetical protein